MHRDRLEALLNDWLDSPSMPDYGPNGIQCEGREEVQRLATACTASLAACQAAVAAGADALLVHHGWFWGGGQVLRGPLARRVACLMTAGITLYAYHLPLDAHPRFGNNALIMRRFEITTPRPFAAHRGSDIGWYGDLSGSLTPAELAGRLSLLFGQEPRHCPGGPATIRSLGAVSGGGQSHLVDAAALGLDTFVTGEAGEQTWHEAAELGIHCFACGHHASEDLAVHELGATVAEDQGLEHVPLRLTNPC